MSGSVDVIRLQTPRLSYKYKDITPEEMNLRLQDALKMYCNRNKPSNEEIAKRVGMSAKTIDRWIKKYHWQAIREAYLRHSQEVVLEAKPDRHGRVMSPLAFKIHDALLREILSLLARKKDMLTARELADLAKTLQLLETEF